MTEPYYEKMEDIITEPDDRTPSELDLLSSNSVNVPQVSRHTAPITKNVGNIMQILKIIVLIKLGLATVVMILGTVCLGILLNDQPGLVCITGTGIWVGMFGVVSASFGIAATRNPKSRCLLIAHFVLCVVISVLTFLLAVQSSANANYAHGELERNKYAYNYKSENGFQAGMSVNVTLAFLAGIYFVCAIIASSLICRLWSQIGCCNAAEQHQPPPVIFIHDQSEIEGVNLHDQVIIIQQGKQKSDLNSQMKSV